MSISTRRRFLSDEVDVNEVLLSTLLVDDDVVVIVDIEVEMPKAQPILLRLQQVVVVADVVEDVVVRSVSNMIHSVLSMSMLHSVLLRCSMWWTSAQCKSLLITNFSC